MENKPRERILQAACELFYRQGIKATGVDAIAKLAGSNKMTLYSHFASKDELVLAFLRKRDEDFTAWLLAQVNSKAQHPKAQLLAIFDVLGEWVETPEFRGCAFINAAAEFALENNPVHQATAEFYQRFRGYLRDLATACGIVSAQSLAMQLSLIIQGAIVSEQMQRQSHAVMQAKQAAKILIDSHLKH